MSSAAARSLATIIPGAENFPVGYDIIGSGDNRQAVVNKDQQTAAVGAALENKSKAEAKKGPVNSVPANDAKGPVSVLTGRTATLSSARGRYTGLSKEHTLGIQATLNTGNVAKVQGRINNTLAQHRPTMAQVNKAINSPTNQVPQTKSVAPKQKMANRYDALKQSLNAPQQAYRKAHTALKLVAKVAEMTGSAPVAAMATAVDTFMSGPTQPRRSNVQRFAGRPQSKQWAGLIAPTGPV